MIKATKSTARRLAAALPVLLLAASGTGAPGHAEMATAGAATATPADEFAVAFTEYADLPEHEPVAGAVDIAAIEPAAQREISGGMASWYGPKFRGRRTASGETFDPSQLTAAHRSLPFGSKVKVTNLGSGRSVVVRINDRGPYAHGRVIDVSQAAAAELGLIGPGQARVSLAVLED